MSMAVPSRSIPLFLSVFKYVNQKVQASPFTNHKMKCYIIFQNNLPAFQLNFYSGALHKILDSIREDLYHFTLSISSHIYFFIV